MKRKKKELVRCWFGSFIILPHTNIYLSQKIKENIATQRFDKLMSSFSNG